MIPHKDTYYNVGSNDIYYSDKMIYSPNVEFFRDDNGNLLDKVVKCDVITCACVNQHLVSIRNGSTEDISKKMIKRYKAVLTCAWRHMVLII